MTTSQSTPRLSPAARHATGPLIAVLALIALGATVLVLALTSTSATEPVVHNQPSTYYPLIHYYGTGAPPALGPTSQRHSATPVPGTRGVPGGRP